MSLPLEPKILVGGIVSETSTVFKSNLSPLLLHFKRVGPDPLATYPIIFKNGDDLRQDQLVVQLFTLMDRLLRKENLNLQITLYKVLATSVHAGMMQFVPSKTIAVICAEFGSIQNYLRQFHPHSESKIAYGIDPSVMDNFVKSTGKSFRLYRRSN